MKVMGYVVKVWLGYGCVHLIMILDHLEDVLLRVIQYAAISPFIRHSLTGYAI